MKRTFVALLLAPTLALAQNPQARVITLDEAVQMAQLNSPQALQARNQITQAHNAVTDAYGAFLPTASAGAGINRRAVPGHAPTGARPGWDSELGTSTNLSINLPAPFDPAMYLNITSAKLGVQTAEIQESQQEYTLKQTVQTNYYTTLRNRETLTSQRSALAIAQQNYQFMLVRYRNGAVAITDSLASFASLQQAQVNVLNADVALANSYLQLQRTVGSQTPIETAPSDTGAIQYVQIDSIAMLAAIETNPSMQLQDITTQTRKLTVKQRKYAYIPKVTWGLNYSRNGSGPGVFGYGGNYFDYSGTDNTAWQSLRVTMTLFNGFSREHQMEQANLALGQQQLTYQDQLLNQRQLVQQAINSLRTSQSTLDLLQTRVQAAEQNLTVTQTRYNVGAETQINVQTAQDGLTSARINLINERFNYRNNLAALELLIGKDLP